MVGSRPDGWWRDRAGAAVRLHDELAKLAARGAAGIPAELLATADGDQPPGPPGAGVRPDPSGLVTVGVVLVLEGAARAAAPRIAERARSGRTRRGPRTQREGDGGTVQVVSAPGSGDDEIVRLAQACAGPPHRGDGRPGTPPPVPGRRGPGGRAVLAVRLAVT